VLKRLSRVTVNGGIRAVNVLPRKINPCSWDRILEYWQNPIGDRQPEPSEIPNDFELSILDGVLTEDQKDVLHINRVEAGKPVTMYEPVPAVPQIIEAPAAPAISLEDLVAQYGVDRIVAANNGVIPGTQDELELIAGLLALEKVS
jgi:hypothetical protein